MKKIRVLVVDDSPLFREFITKGLSTNSQIEVVGTAGDPYEARDQIVRLQPDVMTCDIEMPRMDGIEFVRKLIPQYSLPVVMISSLSDRVFEALKAGAVDFVAKPQSMTLQSQKEFIEMELIPRVLAAGDAELKQGDVERSSLIDASQRPSFDFAKTKDIVIAIGASTGGTEAIFEVVKRFGKNIPGIVVTQHIPPMFSKMFAERLDRQCEISCKEAETGDIIKPGQLYVAPGDRQMRVIKVGDNYQIECKGSERVNGHCPSVDVLFDSVAKAAGKNAIGIILTGMGSDGAKGLLNMKDAGAVTLGQNKDTSVVYGMPMEAYKLGAVKYQLPLTDIPRKVESLLARIR